MSLCANLHAITLYLSKFKMLQKRVLKMIWENEFSLWNIFCIKLCIYLSQIPQTTETMGNRLMKENHNTLIMEY